MPGNVGLRGFVLDLWRMVFVRPIRYGTFDLSAHSRGVAGIAVGVGTLYAITVASIVFANPLRSLSTLNVFVSGTEFVAIPGLLIPAVLCLLGVAFGLLLAGSQRSPWWRRILYLIVVWGALISVAGLSVGLGSRGPLAIACAALSAVVLLYCFAMWTGRTSPAWDAVILVVLASGILLAAYRAVVLQALVGTGSGELITVSFILAQVSSLALPIAFLSGVNATEFGVSLIAWGGADLGRRTAGRLLAPALVVLVLGWQWQALVRECIDDSGSVSAMLRQGVGAALLIALCLAIWRVAHRRVADPVTAPVEVGTGSVRLALPVAYGFTAPAFIAALLGALAASLNPLVSSQVTSALTSLIDILATDAFTNATRVLVVAGLGVGSVLLVRRGAALLGAIAGVDSLVLATYFWIPPEASDWMWTPSSIGNVGLVIATVLAVAWSIQRTWDKRRMSFLLVLALLSALIRQADFFALPLGFLIGASAVAVLVIGLVWGFLTDGGGVHGDAPRFPRDRRLLTVLGEFLFATTVVAWAVIGKDVDMSSTLSGVSSQAVLTIGSALVICVVLAAAPMPLRRGKRSDTVPADAGSHRVEG